jgi:hypothetical protein
MRLDRVQGGIQSVNNSTFLYGKVSPNIVMVIKPRMMSLTGHVAQMEDFLGDPDYLKDTVVPWYTSPLE